MVYDRFTVVTFGLNKEQTTLVKKYLPNKNYKLLDTDEPTDIIAIPSTTIIINADMLNTDDTDMLFSYYLEVNSCCDETVIWLGKHKPLKKLHGFFKCYDSFNEIADNLKYLLLTAYRKSNKSIAYSKNLSYGITILSLIRNHPGISTKDISEHLELPIRTIQRYIEALKSTGEWIQYDTAKRGWNLFHGISILFGDCWKDNAK